MSLEDAIERNTQALARVADLLSRFVPESDPRNKPPRFDFTQVEIGLTRHQAKDET